MNLPQFVSAKRFREARNNLNAPLGEEKYLCNFDARKIETTARKALPATRVGRIFVYINPFTSISSLRLRSRLKNYEKHREAHNENFIEEELDRRKTFFKDVEGQSLDEQQRRAVVSDEDNCLVVAGAGSGKTTTIVAKIQYLLNFNKTGAEEILPISFTRKSAESLKKRIAVKGVDPQTFHKFGLTVVHEAERRKPKIYDGRDSKKRFQKMLEDLSKDEKYLQLLSDFFLHYIKIPKSQFDFETHGAYIQYLKDQDFSTYKKIPASKRSRRTFRSETVNSIEECTIANILLFNRVDYEYESPYPHPISGSRRTYKPDFTIKTKAGDIYLEHLGMNRDGNVPSFFAGPDETPEQASARYARVQELKRETHARHGTTMIETFSYEFFEGTLINNLLGRLKEAGVKVDPMSPKEMWDVIRDGGKSEVDAFIELCQTFLSLLKSNDSTVEEIAKKNEETEDEFLRLRTEKFLELFAPIYEKYESFLEDGGMIDFNDMISLATGYISSGEFSCPYKYVIIDEFQDLSLGRYKLLQAIQKQIPAVKFYCVGDDWQSIFRFTGSDITLFHDFQTYFGFTREEKIETTYRFGDPLIEKSSQFILKNPNQKEKELSSFDEKKNTRLGIHESEGTGDDDTEVFLETVGTFLKEGLSPKDKTLILGRYTFDIDRIKSVRGSLSVNKTSGTVKYKIPSGSHKGKMLEMEFLTGHKAKGEEADYVVVLNCNSGKYGFPSGKADDPILNLVLSKVDQFENGEERRLFYVAMTRTKEHVAFITNRYRKSKFIKEMQDEDEDRDLRCPKCHDGELILRRGPKGSFYGCSNFAYGCDFSSPFDSDDPGNIKTTPASLLPGMAVPRSASRSRYSRGYQPVNQSSNQPQAPDNPTGSYSQAYAHKPVESDSQSTVAEQVKERIKKEELEVVSIGSARTGRVKIRGKVESINSHVTPRKRLMITEAYISDETGRMKAAWFNKKWQVENSLEVGSEYTFIGNIDSYRTLRSPMFTPATKQGEDFLVGATDVVVSKVAQKHRAKVKALTQAVKKNERVEISYVDSGDEKSSRIVRPTRIAEYKGHLYCQGYCETEKDARIFRIDRLTITGHPDS